MKTNKELLNSMDISNKARLFVGKNYWEVESIDGYNIFMSDGPHGLRKEVFDKNKKSIVKAICYPSACLSACSFDVKLLNQLGKELGSECIHNNVDILLGPGINIKRNPLCGRNFEYFSEDPLLSGKLASAYINGVQSKNVGVSLKHFALNSQELARFINNSLVDERAMREIYLKAFEIAIKESDPWTIMASYNVVNGLHATENKYLLNDIGRKEFGFNGIYISDWGALNNPVESLKAGLDLEMPGISKGSSFRIVQSIGKGLLDDKILDDSAKRMIDLYQKTQREKIDDFDLEKSLRFAKKMNDESIVLLKNEDSLLPLDTSLSVALIGSFAEEPRFQGGGSSKINPIYMDNLVNEFKKSSINFTFSKGYKIDSLKADKKLIKKACNCAKNSDVAIILCGLPKVIESEGYDRFDMKMPESHLKLINEVSKVNQNVIVILQNGSPVEMPFVNNVKGIIEAYLGGSKHAESIKDILFGIVNPSGRLSESFPIKYQDCPSSKFFLENARYSTYRESIYVGYRYYLSKGIKTLFPFGYGLSYSNVEYKSFKVQEGNEDIKCSFILTNQSDLNTKEVVQIYGGLLNGKVFRAKKSLLGFTKVDLQAHETKEVEISFSKEQLKYFSIKENKYLLEQGTYRVYLAKHSEDDSCYIDIDISSDDIINEEYDEVYSKLNRDFKIDDLEQLMGKKIEVGKNIRPFTVESPICDFKKSIAGFIVFNIATVIMILMTKDKMEKKMLKKVIPYQPLRSLQTNTTLTKENLEGLCDIFNYHPIKGLKKLMSKKERI